MTAQSQPSPMMAETSHTPAQVSAEQDPRWSRVVARDPRADGTFYFAVDTTATYTDIAARIGPPKGARAVAQACAANTLAVAIPCHRLVRTDGTLSGYRWGLERKRSLLKKEGAA